MASVKFFAIVAAALLLSSSVSACLPAEAPELAASPEAAEPAASPGAAPPGASPEAAMKQGRGGDDCVFAGHCQTKYDCMKPCRDLGFSPTAVLCQPYIGGKTCCCLQ